MLQLGSAARAAGARALGELLCLCPELGNARLAQAAGVLTAAPAQPAQPVQRRAPTGPAPAPAPAPGGGPAGWTSPPRERQRPAWSVPGAACSCLSMASSLPASLGLVLSKRLGRKGQAAPGLICGREDTTDLARLQQAQRHPSLPPPGARPQQAGSRGRCAARSCHVPVAWAIEPAGHLASYGSVIPGRRGCPGSGAAGWEPPGLGCR